ncbi:MAG: ankyrin repeat domain-containing protein [Parachlamydiaceae bacterium]|nr:ankyrin repeat domain-containing protein [Parachlamydiaceae bacterium]
MNLLKTISQERLKLTRKCKCFFLVLTFLLQGTIASSLHASTIYSTSILDNKDNESVFLEAIKNNLDAVRSLINSGHDVNESNKYGYTPLMGAVYKGNIEIVKLFISAGAELEAYDNQGNTPFMYAFYGSEEKKSIVEFLLSLNVNTEIMNSQEQTPLILATLNNHCKSMELLIEFGVNIEAKGKSGSTPLMHAANNQNIESAKLLIKYGANLEARDDWSFTSLMLAALRNDGSMIRVLLNAGADVNARTTKSIPISLKKDWRDFFPQKVYIPIGSTALDIAKQFEKRFAENILINEGHAQ